MEYIILDLEWDSVYFPPQKRFINQILQIGAVKLDENFETVDTLSINIRSSVSKKVSGRFAALTGITSEIMLSGIPFDEAVEQYNEFSKNADVVMTWSTSDLYTIIENEDLLLKKGLKFKMKNYLDLQKLVQGELRNKGYESKNQISLENAAELSGVDTENFSLHTALDDCRVCAILFKKCYNKSRFEALKKDATSPDFYARLRFKPYSISNINDSNIKREELIFNCPECKGKARKLKPFKYHNRWFSADFQCEKCGFKFSGRVAFRKTYDELLVKHKVCEYKAKKRKNTNDMQPVPEKV